MVYTVTLNPALDYAVHVPGFQLGGTNRVRKEQILPGGKGLNVSTVLTNLGVENTALGFVAGFTGDEIGKRMDQAGVKCDFIRICEGCSRINVKLKSGEETEINGVGPKIEKPHVDALLQKLDTLERGDVLVLAGSIPAGLSDRIYEEIMERLQERGVLIAVDATKDLLCNVLRYRPFLIKPNNHELGDIFGVPVSAKAEAARYAKKLQEQGARNVLVSMAGEGAVLLSETGQVLESAAPKGKVVNSVGAGDSMVAGFLAGWLERQDYLYAFRMGLAAGSASAFSACLATKPEVEHIYKSIAFDSIGEEDL